MSPTSVDYENLIRLYEEKEAGEPLFLFNVTMQNHSGYQMSWTNLPREVWLTGAMENRFQTVNQYLSLVYQSDLALEYLIDYFSQVEEPTMILLFGDHQPQVATNFYTQVLGDGPGYRPGPEEADGALRPVGQLRHPGGGWGGALPQLPVRPAAGHRRSALTGYQKYQRELWEQAPVINTLGVRDAQGGTGTAKTRLCPPNWTPPLRHIRCCCTTTFLTSPTGWKTSFP